MKALIEPLKELGGYSRLLKCINTKNTPVLATGVIDVAQTHLIHALNQHTSSPSLIITYSELRAKEIYEDMLFFTKNVMNYPSRDLIFYNVDVHSQDIAKKRFSIIDSLLKNEAPVIILSAEALFDRLMKKEDFKKHIITLNTGDNINMNTLIEKLIFMGYERTELVEGTGQFSSRGGIIDIFTPTNENIYRIEFWDTEIDSIRIVDSYSQRSIENISTARILPVRELVYEKNDALFAAKAIQNEYLKVIKDWSKKNLTEEIENLNEHIGENIEKLKNDYTFSGIENYINYFNIKTASLLDYVPENTIIYFDEPQRIQSHCDTVLFEFEESIKRRISKGYLLPSQISVIYGYDEIIKMSEKFPCVLITTISQNISGFKIKDTISFSIKSSPSFQQKMDLFCEEIQYLKKEGYKTFILAGGQIRCERLIKELYERNIEAAFVSDLDNTSAKNGSIIVAKGALSRGFQYSHINLAIFSDKELFGDSINKKSIRKKKKGATIESFTDLKIGDYVVHDNHGIGIFEGLEKINVEGINKDYLKISYSDGGNLFVPVNQIDLIQKYIGSNSSSPKLNKLGGQEWARAKAKVRNAVVILAEDLVKIYAKRETAKGFKYSPDNSWQKEFEETFPYEETEDQLSAIEDVKKDMELGKVMDRLICGDVGYGKTEIAIRAAFKAVQDNKQVAYLVPTTILAQQHFNTFEQRMKDYPISINMLSRFRTAKQQKETLKGLENGTVDIVIGTHRLLSKDVKFKNLGMIVVDEEQRFGVIHKEKLKAMKENINVLTLTATPIPRTLHMSLSGIRDMSVLEEPPQERYPIQTYVMENSSEFIRDAIHRELARGGQVYYLHNRVNNISEETFRLQKLIPEATISYAHGQMTERELESIMKDFIEGKIDVMVCTTIIETGLDIPNVNTIIIQDADKMGLSQLYQLRGRVGRSNKLAYAYLMYQRNKVLQEIAEKRLQTIKEFTEFGSGFKIAMRDLEIRGAGNLLGAEQHGHMETVGYDMYCKLLNESVNELKGEKPKEEFETSIDLNINAYIPSFYIENEEQRLEIYKKISLITNTKSFYDVQDEIEDRFGNLPKSVNMLLQIALIKAHAHYIGITSILQKQKNIILYLKPDAEINPSIITDIIIKNNGLYLFTSGATPYITIKTNVKDNIDQITYIKNLLQSIHSFD